ncbi:unnamed protein product [Peniophora sp. CBMAI 1063]|nr:unnamed protein product [Peniophora sp. CBMAI 1063]
MGHRTSDLIHGRRRRDRSNTARGSSTPHALSAHTQGGPAPYGGHPSAHPQPQDQYTGHVTPAHQAQGGSAGHHVPPAAAAGPGPSTQAYRQARASGYAAPSSHAHGSSGSSFSGFTAFGSGQHDSGSSYATTQNNQFWGQNLQQASPPHSNGSGSGSGQGSGHASISTFTNTGSGSGSGQHSGPANHSNSHSQSGSGSPNQRRSGHPSASLPNIHESPREYEYERHGNSR